MTAIVHLYGYIVVAGIVLAAASCVYIAISDAVSGYNRYRHRNSR